MGSELNESGDLIPAENLYEACRVMARHVRHLGGMKWDFSRLFSMKIDPEFERLVGAYLESVLGSDTGLKGWKLPETTLIYPWISRMFPQIHYIFWVRDPRDSILSGHLTDDLADFGVPYEPVDDIYLRRAVSWKYQSEIFKATPRPQHLLEIRFEDFINHQEETLAKISRYLGVPLQPIPIRKDSVGRWKTAEHQFDYPFLNEELAAFQYV